MFEVEKEKEGSIPSNTVIKPFNKLSLLESARPYESASYHPSTINFLMSSGSSARNSMSFFRNG